MANHRWFLAAPPDEVAVYDHEPTDISTPGAPFDMMDALVLAGTTVVPPIQPLAVLFFCAKHVSDFDTE